MDLCRGVYHLTNGCILVQCRALCFPVSSVLFFASGMSWNVRNAALFIEVGSFGMVTGTQWKQQFELKSGMFGQG